MWLLIITTINVTIQLPDACTPIDVIYYLTSVYCVRRNIPTIISFVPSDKYNMCDWRYGLCCSLTLDI